MANLCKKVQITFAIFLVFIVVCTAIPAQAFDITKPIKETNPMPVAAGDSPSLDAAGRFRESQPYALFIDSRTDDIGPLKWEDTASGVGATSTYNINESTVSLTVGTGAADYEYRQSRYIQYIPGKSQSIKITFVDGVGVANVAKRVGYFDDNNGIFFQQLGNILSMCLRTSTSGSPVDSCIAQSSWNLDMMDGTGPSKITLDITKTQLLVIDFLWQGVGRVRYGFSIDGKIYYVHQVLNSNVIALPYMASASLPIRFEIRNIGVSAGSTLKQICVSVDSEGSSLSPGYGFSASTGITPRAVTTRTPVISIRLATTYDTKANRRLVRLIHTSFHTVTNDSLCEVVRSRGVSATVGGSWVAVDSESGVEVNVGITSITATYNNVINIIYGTAGQGQAAQITSESLDFGNELNFISQNNASTQSEMFTIYCTSFTGTSNITGEINWIEIK